MMPANFGRIDCSAIPFRAVASVTSTKARHPIFNPLNTIFITFLDIAGSITAILL
ncbi:MAG TPA: hypothetical protein VF700_09660 [Segetibacter sp.]